MFELWVCWVILRNHLLAHFVQSRLIVFIAAAITILLNNFLAGYATVLQVELPQPEPVTNFSLASNEPLEHADPIPVLLHPALPALVLIDFQPEPSQGGLTLQNESIKLPLLFLQAALVVEGVQLLQLGLEVLQVAFVLVMQNCELTSVRTLSILNRSWGRGLLI